jgi:hypothetical protein
MNKRERKTTGKKGRRETGARQTPGAGAPFGAFDPEQAGVCPGALFDVENGKLVPQYTPTSAGLIARSLPPLQIRTVVIKGLAKLDAETAEEKVSRLATAQWGRERVRSHLRAIALTGVKTADDRMADLSRQIRPYQLERDGASPLRLAPRRKKPSVFVMPAFWVAVVALALAVWGLRLELLNGEFLAMASWIGFEDRFDALCFVAPYVLAPFVLLKFAESPLDKPQLVRFRRIVGHVGVALTVIGVMLFASVMGGMHASADMLGGDADAEPPLGVLYGIGMMLLSLGVYALWTFALMAWNSLYSANQKVHPVRGLINSHLDPVVAEHDQWVSVRSQMLFLKKRLEDDAQYHVELSLSVLLQQQEAIACDGRKRAEKEANEKRQRDEEQRKREYEAKVAHLKLQYFDSEAKGAA